MSTTLSTISRQFEPSIVRRFHVKSVHSPSAYPSISGIVTSGGGGLLWIVPDVQLAVAFQRGPRLRPSERRNPSRIGGDARAATVTRPSPVVERARHGVTLDRALGEIAAHVRAVAVEYVQRALAVCENDQFRAEHVDRMRIAVAELVEEPPQAVPSSRVAGRWRADSMTRTSLSGSVIVYLRYKWGGGPRG